MFGTEPRLLGGRYQIGEVLGYGGMAEVYRGRDVRLGREVAVKTLRADLARDPSFHARFRREAQSAASLNHPAIVSVYDTGEDDSSGVQIPYIVMEYVEGRTLRDVLAGEGRLTQQRALEIVADVAGALEYSHRAGIIHRDIKPANVMLTVDGAVKVMDFGIARAMTGSTTMTQTAAVIGTAQYLSPEQARGEKVDARSDVYAVGVLLYELLAGMPPFRGDSPVAVAYQHVREDPRPPSALEPDLSPEADAIVLKALAKNPANRYQSAGEMRADIERALNGRPVLATPVLRENDAPRTAVIPPRPPTVAPTGGAPPQRRRSRAWTYVLVGLAVVAVFVLAAGLAKTLLDTGTSGKIQVRSVLNERFESARDQLRRDGFSTIARRDVPNAAATGLVVDQDPKAGTVLAKTATITLSVSSGPGKVQVPAVVGLTEAQARQQLQQAGFTSVTSQTTTGGSDTPGTVVKVDPAAGQSVDPSTTVTLTVQGSGGQQVGDYRGMSLNEALQAVRADGFDSSVRTQRSSRPSGQVIDQSPAPGSSASRGSTVTLVVSEQQQQQSPPQATPPPRSTQPPPATGTRPPSPSPPTAPTASPTAPTATATASPAPPSTTPTPP
ncbi:MAG TPA: Stk1 family PASTA domain-containing Ser/Thr kinase [Frankiaceae bacterium]|nr:Stk1 family PASTA domain-containing Ser/Thr kinase [Frankiaceae bacterium]